MRRMGPLALRYRADGLSGHTADTGTTLTATLFSGGRAALAHAGDSRAFRLRGGQLRPSTEDHTIGKPRRDAGLLRRRSHGTWAAGRAVRPVLACWTCGQVAATRCAPADSARSWTTERTGMYSLCARISRSGGGCGARAGEPGPACPG